MAEEGSKEPLLGTETRSEVRRSPYNSLNSDAIERDAVPPVYREKGPLPAKTRQVTFLEDEIYEQRNDVMSIYLYPDCQIGAILTVLFFLTCTCYLWVFTIPALLHTYSAYKSDKRGSFEMVSLKLMKARQCNIAAVMGAVASILLCVIVGALFALVSSLTSA